LSYSPGRDAFRSLADCVVAVIDLPQSPFAPSRLFESGGPR